MAGDARNQRAWIACVLATVVTASLNLPAARLEAAQPMTIVAATPTSRGDQAVNVWLRGTVDTAMPAVRRASRQLPASDTSPNAALRELDPTFKPLDDISLSIAPSRGELPADVAAARFAAEPTFFDTERVGRPWLQYAYHWQASGLCHKPLYFEQPNLERYGYNCGIAQPFISAAHFFGTIPLLPYKMALDPPCECVYDLGYSRPGSCAPFECHVPRFSADALLVEGAVITGLIFLIP